VLSLTQCSRFFPRRLFADAVEMIEAMGAVSDAVLDSSAISLSFSVQIAYS